MENKSKTLAKNTAILSIGQLIPKILTLITLPILTGAFSTEEYGIYDLVISFSSLFLPLMTLLIQQAVFRFLIDSNSDKDKKTYITNSVSLIFIISIVIFLVGLIIGKSVNANISILVIAFFIYLIESLYDLFGQVARGIGKNSWYSTAVVIYSIANMLFLLFSLYTKIININNVLIIVVLSYLSALIFLIFKIKAYKYFDFKKISYNKTKELLKYSIPIIPSSIALWIVNLSDRLIITTMIGNSYNGVYAAACKIPNMFATIFNVFNLAWTELAARSIEEKEIDKYYTNLFKNLYCFLMGALMALISISPILFNILIDSKFNEGFNQLPILYLGVLFSCFVSFYGGLYIALKKTKQVGISSIAGAIINIIINILFIKSINLYAASISTLISFIVICLYRAMQLQRYIEIKYNIKDIIIGIVGILLVITCYYINNIFAICMAILISIAYNLKFNVFLVSFLKFFVKKLKRRND